MSTLAPSKSPEAAATAVEAFIAAKNEWEVASWKRMREARGTEQSQEHWAEAARTLALVHDVYLTPRRRAYAEQPSFQHPPSYDLKREAVTASSIEGNKAFVETTKTGVLGAGRYRYSLQLRDSQWLVDSVKQLIDGQWKSHVL